jgi:UDP-N-acetylglucosamine enolpyruvyl transferase
VQIHRSLVRLSVDVSAKCKNGGRRIEDHVEGVDQLGASTVLIAR